MNKETFNQLLQAPSKVDPKYKKDLAQLITSFPYSANIRILYLSALLNDGDIHFEKELKKSAAYITDRRVLRKLIDRPQNQAQYIIDEPTAQLKVIKAEDDNLEITPKVEAEKPKVEPEVVVDESTINQPLDEDQPVKEKEITPEIKVTPSEVIKTEEGNLEITPKVKSEKPKAEPEVVVDKNTRIQPLDETQTVKEENVIKEVQEPVTAEQQPINSDSDNENSESLIPELDDQIIASAVHASLSIEVEEFVPETPIETEKDSTPQEDEKKSFLDWIGAPQDDFKTSTDLDPKQKERIEFKKKAEDLINQFIANQPRIDVKKEFFSPGNMAKKSVEDKAEIVTETLAGVYAAQGDIQKAINTYQQLILRFPEKKSYFATLIEKLKE